ncbi:MAG: hypothetical protein FWE45_00385 [Firmicutes bacterium]|nr:hypothetical protein [Bacillota bacterium]
MADTPFPQSNDMLLFTFSAGPTINLFNLDVTTVNATLQNNLPFTGQTVALAFNAQDDFVYTCVYNSEPPDTGKLVDIVRLDSDLNTTSLGLPDGLPVTTAGTYYYASYIDKDGFWFLSTNGATSFYVIDMRPGSPTFFKLVDPTNGFQEQTGNYGTPFVSMPPIPVGGSRTTWVRASDGLLYQVYSSYNTSTQITTFGFISIDPTTGIAGQASGGPWTIPSLDAIFAMTIDSNDTIYIVTGYGKLFFTFEFSNGIITGQNLGTVDIGTYIPYGAAMNPLADPGSSTVPNFAQWDVTDCDGITTTMSSNTTTVEVVDVEITKTASCSWVLKGGVISYCVTLSNQSDIDLVDTLFRDTLNSRLVYVTGSFTVDGVETTPLTSGQTISYELDLNAKTIKTICFKARLRV